MHRIRSAYRLSARFAVVAVASLLASAGPGLAQGEELCANPRSFCGASVPPDCAGYLSAEDAKAVTTADCAAAVKGYRYCLREAADCPGVVDQKTPEAPREANATCAGGGCADAPQKPSVRAAPEAPKPRKNP